MREYSKTQIQLLQDPKTVEFFRRAKEELAPSLMSKPNVIALGIGLRRRGGKLRDEVTLKVYVSKKLRRDLVSDDNLIPPSLEFENKDVPIDVEEAELPVAHLFTLRSRPLIGGSSIGAVGGGTGTLGCNVTLDDGQTYILSCEHVLARVGQLAIGTNILQPSAGDGGAAPNDVVAQLAQTVPIDFGTTTITLPGFTFTVRNSNHVDCALATTVNAFDSANREIYWLGYPAFRIREYETGLWQALLLYFQPVHKMGRTTEYTVGRVKDLSWDGLIDYSALFGNPPGTDLAWFSDQLQIEELHGVWARRGDSGSLVLDAKTNKPVGLHFAGNAAGTLGYANPITRVIDALRLPRI